MLRNKVPEVTAAFWVAKILTTGMGETTSDFLVHQIDPPVAVATAHLPQRGPDPGGTAKGPARAGRPRRGRASEPGRRISRSQCVSGAAGAALYKYCVLPAKGK